MKEVYQKYITLNTHKYIDVEAVYLIIYRSVYQS